jgi:ABC-type Mn2+/Zn2+ transport system permease subunit/Mn-dependent DtxR family transcriptional regulator
MKGPPHSKWSLPRPPLDRRVGISWIILFLCALPLQGEQISSQGDSILERSHRFLTLSDESVRMVLLGTILMGLSCGVMGGLVVTRRLSLFGDTLSHAVLPGVAVGFLWSQSKDSWAILVGASVAGFLGVALISLLRKTSRIRQDSALGLVLSGFYALGICMLTRIQKMEFGNQSGIDKYLFGQVVGLSSSDLWTMAFSCLLILTLTILLYKELLVAGFDSEYARSIGLPVDFLQYLLWLLLAFAVITSLQIVGVVLVSALLVIPAATASLITDKMRAILIWSAMLGCMAGATGAFLSFLGNQLPTGPIIVLVSAVFFLWALFFHPQNGLLFKWLAARNRNQRIAMENTLKAVYQELESIQFQKETTSVSHLAKRRRIGMPQAHRETDALVARQYATVHPVEDKLAAPPRPTLISLTPKGWGTACRIVRNHRLWELYLTNEARYAPDHVHDDAEKIEHVLGEETVRRIERILSNPKKDPHGKLIPSQQDIDRGFIA